MTDTKTIHAPRFRIEGPNGTGHAVLIIDADRVDLGPWKSAAEVMSRWLETAGYARTHQESRTG